MIRGQTALAQIWSIRMRLGRAPGLEPRDLPPSLSCETSGLCRSLLWSYSGGPMQRTISRPFECFTVFALNPAGAFCPSRGEQIFRTGELGHCLNCPDGEDQQSCITGGWRGAREWERVWTRQGKENIAQLRGWGLGRGAMDWTNGIG